MSSYVFRQLKSAFRSIRPSVKGALLVFVSCFFTFKGAEAQVAVPSNDSITKPIFDVSKTSPDNENDLRNRPIDLRNPKNIDDTPEYDEKTGNYKLGTVVKALNITLENAHRALADAYATAKVFIKLI